MRPLPHLLGYIGDYTWTGLLVEEDSKVQEEESQLCNISITTETKTLEELFFPINCPKEKHLSSSWHSVQQCMGLQLNTLHWPVVEILRILFCFYMEYRLLDVNSCSLGLCEIGRPMACTQSKAHSNGMARSSDAPIYHHRRRWCRLHCFVSVRREIQCKDKRPCHLPTGPFLAQSINRRGKYGSCIADVSGKTLQESSMGNLINSFLQCAI